MKTSISTAPLPGEVGVEVTGVEFAEASTDDDFRIDLRETLANHRLVLMRNQELEPHSLTDFMSRFGPLLDLRWTTNNAHHVPGNDKIKVISNAVHSDGRPLGDGNSNAQIWHSDSTTWEIPVATNAMYCQFSPAVAPHTTFLDMIKTYADLPDETKARIRDLRVIHHVYDRQIEEEVALKGPSLPLEQRQKGVVHPLVRRHLPTGLPILYLPTRRDSLVVGWSEADSVQLLAELWSFVEQSPHRTPVALVKNDLLFWDNAATVHSREGWPAYQGRAVWHVAAEGETPTPLYGKRAANIYGSTASPS